MSRKYTAGTNVEKIKEQARKSGLSYNEAKEWMAKSTGGRGTNVFSNTNIEAIKQQNERSERNKSNGK